MQIYTSICKYVHMYFILFFFSLLNINFKGTKWTHETRRQAENSHLSLISTGEPKPTVFYSFIVYDRKKIVYHYAAFLAQVFYMYGTAKIGYIPTQVQDFSTIKEDNKRKL